MRKVEYIIVRGGGDIATGTIQVLWRAGFDVLVLETAHPSAIRRHVALSEGVYEGRWTVEDITAMKAETLEEAEDLMKQGLVPILIDPEGKTLEQVRPLALVDGILAKKNLGTRMDMADTVVALGPGFTAGVDAHMVIETQRGHHLGRILQEGPAAPNTGIPGVIAGFGKERVIHAPVAGVLKNVRTIGDHVEKGEVIATIGETQVTASLTGILRGLIRDGYPVTKGFKIADIDPRESEQKNCFTISDKARCIGGSVLEGILWHRNRRNLWKK